MLHGCSFCPMAPSPASWGSQLPAMAPHRGAAVTLLGHLPAHASVKGLLLLLPFLPGTLLTAGLGLEALTLSTAERPAEARWPLTLTPGHKSRCPPSHTCPPERLPVSHLLGWQGGCPPEPPWEGKENRRGAQCQRECTASTAVCDAAREGPHGPRRHRVRGCSLSSGCLLTRDGHLGWDGALVGIQRPRDDLMPGARPRVGRLKRVSSTTPGTCGPGDPHTHPLRRASTCTRLATQGTSGLPSRAREPCARWEAGVLSCPGFCPRAQGVKRKGRGDVTCQDGPERGESKVVGPWGLKSRFKNLRENYPGWQS